MGGRISYMNTLAKNSRVNTEREMLPVFTLGTRYHFT